MTPTQAQIDAFLEGCREINHKYLEEKYPGSPKPRFLIMDGQRYRRVIRQAATTDRSVHCFIDMTNGDVLFPAGWKEPSKKTPRGNLNDDKKGLGMMQPHGPAYLR